MIRKKWMPAALLLAAMGFAGMCGCQEKVVTVASVLDEEGQVVEYIEMQNFERKEKQEDDGSGEEVQYCAVMIPAGYYESEEIPGMYLHEMAPLDSSNIYYTVSEGSGSGQVSKTLTKEEYQETIETAFRESGQEGKLEIESFEEVDMEGIPAYKIRSAYIVDGNEIQQLTYLVLAKNTYTITYSQSKDDELMADFEISDGQIRLVREESVVTAKSEE